MRSLPTTFQKTTLWNAATGVAIGIIGILAVGVIWLLAKILGFLQPVLVPLAIAGIIAYLLDPVVQWMQRRGMTRLRGIFAVYGMFLASILVVVASITWAITSSPKADVVYDKPLSEKFITSMQKARQKKYIKPAVDWLIAPVNGETKESELPQASPTPEAEPTPDSLESAKSGTKDSNKIAFAKTRIGHFISANSDKIVSVSRNWLSSGTNKALTVLGFLFSSALIPIYLYYFLKESDSIKHSWKDYVPLKASRFKTEVIESLAEINGYLISFFRGQVLVAFIDGILVGIALTIFQLPYGFLIGLVMAVLGVIPYIGNLICLIPACVIAFVHFDNEATQHILGSNPWSYVAGVLIIFVVVQQINSLVTAPKIVGDSVGLHPMTVIFSMFFWTLILGGFLGALLAVPMTAAIKVLFRRYIWERKLNTNEEEGDNTPALAG